MLTTNPFAAVADLLPAGAMQIYVLGAVLAVVAGVQASIVFNFFGHNRFSFRPTTYRGIRALHGLAVYEFFSLYGLVVQATVFAVVRPWVSDDLSNDIAHAAEGWAKACELMAAGEHQLLIFDELTYLSAFGWLPIEQIVEPIRNRPSHVNVIVTGRDAAPELIDLADTVTEMTEIKHAYQQGIRAMRGIDY